MKLSSQTILILQTATLSAIFTVILLLFVNYFFNHSWNFFMNSQMKTQTIDVKGIGSATAAPDQSDISFTVQKIATTSQETQNQANTLMNTITNDLQKAGIVKKDIQTSNYSSSPNYSDDSQTTIINYRVSENVDVTLLDNTKANTVIDIATKDGATDVNGPNLTFSDAKQKDLQDQAKINAIINARQKAQSMANAADIHLGKIINVKENEPTPFVYPFHPLMMNAKPLAAGEAAVPTQINQGQNTVSATVTLTYQTY